MNESNSVKQKTAAEEITELCRIIRDKTNDLNKYIAEKLSPLYISVPSTASLDKPKDVRNYPEYFSVLRADLSAIDTALDEMRTIIQKVDL
ncbi:MAG: hypothetical protein ABSC54_10030 [Smithellaceae bacterium]|jgi:hypothetical protein